MNPILENDTSSSSIVVPSTKRLRAGGLVAKEKLTGIPYRTLNVRRGNAMRYLVLDYIKQRPYTDKHVLLPTLSDEKRKAMESIAANEFFKYADAYTPEEHFFPLHIKPSGELYYIPEKKVKQMLYVVNKLKRPSLESIVSDVTWESSSGAASSAGDDDDEDQFILDFKTDRVLAKANHCELLANEIEQFYFAKTSDQPCTETEEPHISAECTQIRRSISLPIIRVPKVKYRLKKLSTFSKAASDDNLNIILADINQHQLVCNRSFEQVQGGNSEATFLKELLKIDDEISQLQSSTKLTNSNRQDLIKEAIPSTSKNSVDDMNRPTFFDLIDDIDTYDEINDTIYREINEVKATICGAKDKMGKKFRLTKDDLNIHFDNDDKRPPMNIEVKEKLGDISQPSTSSGVYQNQIISTHTSDDERDNMTLDDKHLSTGERYLMEEILKDEHITNKTKQMIKMKRRVKLDEDVCMEELTDEQILDQIKNKPKRFNVYTLQKLQTEFDTSAIGDTKKSMVTPVSVVLNQSETCPSTTDITAIEMKNFTALRSKKNDSESTTDCEMSDVDENIHKRHMEKFKKQVASSKRVKASTSKLSFNSLSNIPIIGRFFYKKS